MVKYWREVSNVDKRPNPISERSRRRITEALISLMHQKPFGKISIKEVVEEAGKGGLLDKIKGLFGK
jgi:hypothetical protein